MKEEIDYKTAYETAMIGFKMQMQEIERLNNIIKEVREYIEYYLTKGKTKNHKQFETSILEILDKGE